MRRILRNAIIVWLCWCGAALALNLDAPLPGAEQEARARALFHQIRCTVCQGESIADSPAGVAADMRRFIRQRIAAGESDAAIRSFLVEQYGDYILMKPPLKPATYLLWFGPAVILLVGAAAAWRLLFPRHKAS